MVLEVRRLWRSFAETGVLRRVYIRLDVAETTYQLDVLGTKPSAYQVITDGISNDPVSVALYGETIKTNTTKIISCLSLPFSSYFGQTSQ